jgi:hypothetical protein
VGAGLDEYGTIGFVNFVRSEVASKGDIDAFDLLSWTTRQQEWKDEKYLAPFMADDALLCDLDEDSEMEVDEAIAGNQQVEGAGANARAVEVLKSQLRDAHAQMERMRSAFESVVDSKESSTVQSAQPITASELPLVDARLVPGESDGDNPDARGYFNSYAHLGIHEEMLKDRVRTLAYHDFMLQNSELFAGKVVLDVGCGTGILSMIAAKAGASKVIGLDQAKIIETTRQIVAANGLSDKIVLIRSKVEELQWPSDIPPADIIISEWMGYALLYESMYASVLFARDKFLRKGGRVFPDKSELFVRACEGATVYKERVQFWEDSVYGFDMSQNVNMAYLNLVAEPQVRHETQEADMLTAACSLQLFDLERQAEREFEFSQTTQLSFTRNGMFRAFCIYFTSTFNGSVPMVLNTAPGAPYTHWKQTYLWIKNPVKVTAGQTGTFHMAFLREGRELKIVISGTLQAGTSAGEASTTGQDSLDVGADDDLPPLADTSATNIAHISGSWLLS